MLNLQPLILNIFDKTVKNLVWLVLLFAITLLSNCGDDVPTLPAVTAQDLAKVNLSQTWEIGSNGSATRDGQDVSDGFSNFTLTFSSTSTYSSSGGGDVWDTVAVGGLPVQTPMMHPV